MHSKSDFVITVSNHVNQDLLTKIFGYVAEKAPDACVFEGMNSVYVEECEELIWGDDFRALAVDIARMCKDKMDFVIDCVIDGLEYDCGYASFRFIFEDNKLTFAHSEWYLKESGAAIWDDDYETFCKDFDDVPGEHRYSEEFFEKLKASDLWYRTSELWGRSEIWLDGVHMSEPEEIPY